MSKRCSSGGKPAVAGNPGDERAQEIANLLRECRSEQRLCDAAEKLSDVRHAIRELQHRREKHARKAKRERRLRDQRAGPPHEGWSFEGVDTGGDDPCPLGAWVPPGLSAQRWKELREEERRLQAAIEDAGRDRSSVAVAGEGEVAPATRPEDGREPARHSPDFRSVYWFGVQYDFTALQASIVGELWAAWDQGTPDISDSRLLTKADSVSDRLVDLFKSHSAWGTMIVSGATKGTRRLNSPPAP